MKPKKFLSRETQATHIKGHVEKTPEWQNPINEKKEMKLFGVSQQKYCGKIWKVHETKKSTRDHKEIQKQSNTTNNESKKKTGFVFCYLCVWKRFLYILKSEEG